MSASPQISPCTALVVYRPLTALVSPSAPAAKQPTSAVGVSDVLSALVQHSCSGKTAQTNMQLAQGDATRMAALLKHQKKVRQTLKRKMAEALQEAQHSMQSITPLLVETKQRFKLGNLLQHHGHSLHVLDVGVPLVSYDGDEEGHGCGRLRIAVPSEEAFEYMTEDDASFGENGFAEIMEELGQIAIKAMGLDSQVWQPSDAELDPGYYGVFKFYQERLLPKVSAASFKSRAQCANFLSLLGGVEPVASKPRLRGHSLVDAVIYPAGYYKKQHSVRIYSPHTVKSSRVQSMMPAVLTENAKFGCDDDGDDDDGDDEDDEDEGEGEDEEEEEEEEGGEEAGMVVSLPKRQCVRSGASK
jgi:hypothetical protein